MTRDEQERKAKTFLALHCAPPILVLPNAWDVVSAKIFQLEGFKAVGTTSAGIAATLGYPDGQRMSLRENADVVRRIAERIDLPASADLEAGYATSVDGVAEAAKIMLDAGAVGINLEDSTGDPATPLFETALQVEKIRAIREVASARGVPLVINARTDVCLISKQDAAARLRQVAERAGAYRQAGADCIFVPDVGDFDKPTIAALVREIDAPVNIIAGAHTPSIPELQEIGVARVSVGPRPMRATLGLLRRIARELLGPGTYTSMTAEALTYGEVNQMFE
ncbi:MAG: isocitrate lyase/phosphoenolpyruvate mutase family protein [Phycisphaerales bacterium]|nr:MAG: isocitrate lyase/phosphoenolpyruvate mutase family protein [Phycisphaerales bacterium]